MRVKRGRLHGQRRAKRLRVHVHEPSRRVFRLPRLAQDERVRVQRLQRPRDVLARRLHVGAPLVRQLFVRPRNLARSRDARRRRRLPPFQRPHARRRVVRPYASDRGVVVQIVRVPERPRARVRGVLVEHRRRGGFPAARHRRRHRALVRPREGVGRVRARVSDRVVELRGGGGGGGRASVSGVGGRASGATDGRAEETRGGVGFGCRAGRIATKKSFRSRVPVS